MAFMQVHSATALLPPAREAKKPGTGSCSSTPRAAMQISVMLGPMVQHWGMYAAWWPCRII